MTRTAALIVALALLIVGCTSTNEQDVKIAELEATIASGRLAQAEATIQALQGAPDAAPSLATATPDRGAIPVLQVTPTAASNLQQVRIVRTVDGDSGIAVDENGEFEFRLYGIDAPERDDASKAALVGLISEFGSDLYAEERDVDRYGRRVVVLSTRDGSRSVNVEMVRQGYAYAYLDYGELDGVVAAQTEAQTNGHGIWGPPATPTWDEYWAEQDRQGKHHETFMQTLAASPTYANANSDYREFLESLYQPFKAQFDFGQTIGPYVGVKGNAATSLHFRSYLESGPQVWNGETWASLIQGTYELMSTAPTAGSADAKNQARVREALDKHGLSVLQGALTRTLHPIAGQAVQSWLVDQWRGFRGELGPSARQSDFFMQVYPQLDSLHR